MSLNFVNYNGIRIPEGAVKKISRKLDALVLWNMKNINWVPLSINADGTIYNNGLGYKNGYRVRSGGAETAAEDNTCTGFIRVKGGDTIRIYGWNRYTHASHASNAINVADSSFTNIGQISNGNYGIFDGDYAAYNNSTIKDSANGVSEWVVPPTDSGVEYIRVSAYNDDVNIAGKVGERLIVTINEDIVV